MPSSLTFSSGCSFYRVSVILAITSPFHTLFGYSFSINMAGTVPILQYTKSFFSYFLSSFALPVPAISGIAITETGEPGKGARFGMTTLDGGFRFTP
jgi:hypothetical protein